MGAGGGGGGGEREKMTPALRWAAMRAILMFCEGQSHKTVSTNPNLFEEKGEPKRNRG